MGYAPRSIVATAPDTPSGGSSLHVDADTGARFNARETVPFTALVWEEGETPVEGVNAETIQVIQIIGDELEFARGASPINITTGMHISAISSIPRYERGGSVHLTGHFLSDSSPYTLHLRQPDGSLLALDAPEVTHDGQGNAHYGFIPAQSGMWGYRFRGASGDLDDNFFYVDASAVL